MNKNVLIAVAVGLIVLFVFMKPKKKDRVLSGQAKQATESVSSSASIVDKKEMIQVKKRKAVIEKLRKEYVVERRLGMASHSFPHEDGKMKLMVSFEPLSKWCSLGDLDYMKAHLKANPSKEMVLSVENIQSRKVLKQVPLNLGVMTSGGNVKLDVPMLKESRMAGLFICSSPIGKKYACQSKPPFSFASIKNVKSTKSSNFYFQSIFLRGNEMKVPPTLANQNNQQFYRDLAKYAGNKQQNALRLTQSLSAKMGSIPPKMLSKSVTISMPMADPRCPTSGGELGKGG